MRRPAYHPNVLAKRIHEPEVLGPKKPVLPLGAELPVEQQIEILRCRGGELASRIVKHLLEMSAPEPTTEDRNALIRDRLLIRATGNGDTSYKLTPSGLIYASSIMRHHREALGIEDIHEITYTDRGGRAGVVCSCGQTFGARYGRHPEAAMSMVAEAHLRFVGKLPPIDPSLPRSLQ
jgi:hypothetical protein